MDLRQGPRARRSKQTQSFTKKGIKDMDDLKDVTLEEAKVELGRRVRVYEAAIYFERLEGAGKIHGNGHHMAQNMMADAVKLLEERWLDDKESCKNE